VDHRLLDDLHPLKYLRSEAEAFRLLVRVAVVVALVVAVVLVVRAL
jgi:hypothetical protein